MRARYRPAAEAIVRARNVVLACHVNPDGDTLGSALALAHALSGMGKPVTVLSHDGVPDIYQWMPGAEWVKRDTAEQDFDLSIVCDTGTSERVGSAQRIVESARVTVNIDHHVAEGEFGRIRVVNSRAAATGELVHGLLKCMGVALDKKIADCLMCAIVTDTGSFRYMNVTPHTFKVAGELMACGAWPATISELVFENRSLASIKLLGRALGSLRVSSDGQIAWAHIRASDYEDLGASDEDSEGVVGHVRSVRGTCVGILFREIPGKKIRISLRSREGYDVNAVAQVFGGGGHKLAAGCSIDASLEDAERIVLAEAAKHLPSPAAPEA